VKKEQRGEEENHTCGDAVHDNNTKYIKTPKTKLSQKNLLLLALPRCNMKKKNQRGPAPPRYLAWVPP
jgi:hypothetical protein